MRGLPARNQDPHFCEELSLESQHPGLVAEPNTLSLNAIEAPEAPLFESHTDPNADPLLILLDGTWAEACRMVKESAQNNSCLCLRHAHQHSYFWNQTVTMLGQLLHTLRHRCAPYSLRIFDGFIAPKPRS